MSSTAIFRSVKVRDHSVPVCILLRTAVGLELIDRLVRDCSNPVEAEDDTTTGTVGTTAERWTW